MFPKARFTQFSLRSLLVFVAFCSLACLFGPRVISWVDAQIPNMVSSDEMAQLKRGMTMDEVRSTIGRPDDIWKDCFMGGERYDVWIYDRSWNVTFKEGELKWVSMWDFDRPKWIDP
jgi:hypothetical protein